MRKLGKHGARWVIGAMCVLGALGFALSGCSLDSISAGDGVGGDVGFRVDAEELLVKLFPKLTADERAAIAAELSWEQLLLLRSELEKAREAAAEFSRELFRTAEDRVETRKKDLAPFNNGFPEQAEAVGKVCLYDASAARSTIQLSGVFEGQQALQLASSQVSLRVDGALRPHTLRCLADEGSVDIVFLIDITGSMSNVISSVRDSVVAFLESVDASGLRGTVSVVTFQDTVGVNVEFQEPAPPEGYERSPFFRPVALNDAPGIASLKAFVNRLEANQGNDAPENLSGAIDFARNNVIGYSAQGSPNLIGDGQADPAGTEPFAELRSTRQVFVALTDVSFHGDDRDATNSSLLAPFVPRNAAEILRTLHETGTVVNVSDPSWADTKLDPRDASVDSDFWALRTGGLGEDKVHGYSLVDLELVVVAERTGLLDITLDQILSTSCQLQFEGSLTADARVEVSIETDGGISSGRVPVERW